MKTSSVEMDCYVVLGSGLEVQLCCQNVFSLVKKHKRHVSSLSHAFLWVRTHYSRLYTTSLSDLNLFTLEALNQVSS